MAQKVTLAILSDDDPSEKPLVVVHSFTTKDETQPKCLIRKGHKVRVKSVSRHDGFLEATIIEFDLAQLATTADPGSFDT